MSLRARVSLPARVVAALVVALLALAACDGDDGASVRDLGGSASSGSGSGSGSGTVASGSGSEPACEPPGADEPALTVTLDEYQIAMEEDRLTQGPTRFAATNAGDEPHELILLAARSVEALPLDRNGAVDEEALSEDQLIEEVHGIAPGATCELEVDLEPGTYVLLCNIRERGDDGVVNHFLQGMRTRFKVS